MGGDKMRWLWGLVNGVMEKAKKSRDMYRVVGFVFDDSRGLVSLQLPPPANCFALAVLLVAAATYLIVDVK